MSAYGKKNVGTQDRKYRLIGAGVATALGLFTKGSVRSLLFAVAVILGVTSATRSCPLYSTLGMNTSDE